MFAKLLGDLVPQHGADGTFGVTNGQRNLHLLAPGERRFGKLNELVVKVFSDLVVLAFAAHHRNAWGLVICRKDRCKIQPIGFPMGNCPIDIEQLHLPDSFFERPETQFSKIFPNFLSKVLEEGLHEFGGTVESFPQFRVLGCHTNRASIQVAHPHQYAATHHHGGRCETILFSTQQSSNNDIAPRLHLPVNLKGHSTTQVVAHQGLLSFCKA